MRGGEEENRAGAGRVFFERVLVPQRSLSPRGFRLLMLVLGCFSLGAGGLCIAAGAWPVCGFFGLDLALLYLAFARNYRRARESETLRLSGKTFTVEKVSMRGERRQWRFHPFWLRVMLEERRGRSERLLVGSHGRSLAIGAFLAPTLRRELAQTLAEALFQWKNSLDPAAQDC